MLSDEEIDEMFKFADSDNSGFIDYTEFIVGTVNQEELTENGFLEAAFKMFDKDGSGAISASEIKEVLGFKANIEESVVE
jgi:Ca2+-binding EF-hand superfamily protein